MNDNNIFFEFYYYVCLFYAEEMKIKDEELFFFN